MNKICITGGGFMATVSYSQQKTRTEALGEGLNEGLNSLLNAIRSNNGIQAKDLSSLLDNRPIKTIERQIAALTDRKLIERRGSRKTGGYFIK